MILDIKEILRQGENSAIEFKQSAVSGEALARELTAFANSQGGVILIGIDDDGTVSGIDIQKRNEAWVSNIARDGVIPPLSPEVEIIEWEGKYILVIQAPKGKYKPYQTRDGRYYIRVGSTNRSPSQAELMRLYQQSGVFHFDLTGVEHTGLQDLNLPKIADYFDRYGIDFTSDDDQARLLRNTDILDDQNQVTVAGMLIFGLQPQKHLHHAAITFAQFQGENLDAPLINQQVVNGNIDYQIDTTFALLKNSLPNGSHIEGVLAVPDQPKYEEKIFRELLVNACVHRNYAISGSRIRVLLFSDRLEVRSPGRLPNTVSIEKLSAGVSYAANPVIVKFMENLRYIDKLGRGLPMVWLAAQKLGKQVIFEEVGEEFVVTLYI